MRPQGVIFDMDGVIVDSEPRHERAFLQVVQEIGYEGRHGLRFADYIGRSDRQLWEDFVAKHSPPQSLEELLARKRRATVSILRAEQPFFDGVLELIRELHERYPLALASGSERAVVDAVLELRNLRRLFRAVVTGSDVEHGKPAPDIFLKTAGLLEVEPRGCWVIEDSKPGVAAALAAGMRVIAITNSHPAGELSDATHVVQTFSEIHRLLVDPGL